MNKKYEILTDDFIMQGNNKLYRIRALKDFGDVKAGDLGGFIQSEENLSQEGLAWLYGSADVNDGTWVYGTVDVNNNALVSGKKYINGDCEAIGKPARVTGGARVLGNARLKLPKGKGFGDAKVSGKKYITGDLRVIFGNCSES